MKKIVYFDMDDTLFDFNGAYIRAIEKEPGIIFPQSQLKFFENLEPIDGAIDAYNKLKEKYIAKILTRPSVFNPLSYMEKRICIEKHLGFDECKNLILCHDKTLLRGGYLIDDIKHHGLFEPEWGHIHYGSSDFPTWNDVLNYLL